MTAEWTPLHGGGAEGTPGSPFPADRGQLEISRNELQTTGELILEAANMLRNLTDGDSWTSKAADAYKDTAGKLQKKLDETHPRFTESAAALTSFLGEVDDSLLASARAKVDEAQEAESTIASNPEQTASGGDPLTPEQEASNTARENAQADLDRLQREFDGLVEDAERAAQVAADAIQQAIDDDVKDGLYDFLRPFLEVLKIVLLVVGIIVAIAAFIFGGWVLAVIGLVIALVVFAIAEDHGPARHVLGRPKVQADPAFFTLKLIKGHIRVFAGFPRISRDPRAFCVGPLAEMKPANIIGLAWDSFRLCRNVSKIRLSNRHPQKRVGLGPATRVFQRIIAFIQRADIAEGRIVVLFAVCDSNSVLVLFPADRVPIRPAVGDHQKERLASEFEAPFQHFQRVTVRMLVNFVQKCEVWTKT